jgi:hypothetical protein
MAFDQSKRPVPSAVNFESPGYAIIFSKPVERNLLTDINFHVENEVFNAHRLILAANSPYFKAMFTTQVGTLEKEIVLKDVSAKTFSNFLDVIYGGSFTIDKWQQLTSLLVYADMVQLSIDREAMIKKIVVPSVEYHLFITALDTLYRGNIPVRIIIWSRQFTDYDTKYQEIPAGVINILIHGKS